MPIYTVRQGDCLSSIAEANGLADWRTIYDDPNNEAFRRLRPNPNVIQPGDEVFVPELEDRRESAGTDQDHHYEANFHPILLRLMLLDEDHRPMASTAYTLTLGETVIEGTTDSGGVLEHPIPATLNSARISTRFTREGAETGYTWDLRLGELDPETENTGVQARLNNLGYNTGPVDGIVGPRTTDAIREFQEKYSLTVDGIAGPETRGKLVEVHGC